MEIELHDFYERLNSVSERARELAEQFWETRGEAVDHEHMLGIRPRRTEGHKEILQLVNDFRVLQQQTLKQEEELQVRMGLWLCSFFLGFPLFHLWERIRHLDPVVEGFAGTGALYDKLAGDVYRGERKLRDRLAADPHRMSVSSFKADEPILALAFSPTALLPDEDWDPDGEQRSGSGRELFLWHLRRLAGRYLRLQMWLYFTSGYPVRYTFVMEHAARAVARHYGELGRIAIRKIVEDRFAQMGGDKQKLCGMYRESDERDIWTSCTFGVEDGVFSDSPRAALEHRHFTWVTDNSLKIGRAKLARLPSEHNVLVGDEAIDALVNDALAARA